MPRPHGMYESPRFDAYQEFPDWLKWMYDVCPPKWGPFPSGAPNLWELYDFTSMALFEDKSPLHAHQRYAAMIETEMEWSDELGLWMPRYHTTLYTVPRQLGKSRYEMVGLGIDLLTMQTNDHTMFMAQTGDDAKNFIFNKWTPEMQEAVMYRWLAIKQNKGNKAFLYSETQRTWADVHSGSESAGHGGTLRRLRGDEVHSFDEEMVEQSVGATTRAVVDSQKRYVSTVGKDDSDFMNNLIFSGIDAIETGSHTGLSLIYFGGDEKLDPGDPVGWQQATPSLNVIVNGKGVTTAQMRQEHDNDKSHNKVNFRRTALNQIGKATINTAINLHLFDQSQEPASTFGQPEGKVAIGIDTHHPHGTWTSIAVVDETGRVLLRWHERGRSWVTDRLYDYYHDPDTPRFDAIGMWGVTPLEPELKELEERLPSRVEFVWHNTAQRAAACLTTRDRIHAVDPESGVPIAGLRILNDFRNRDLRNAVMAASAPADDSREYYTFYKGSDDAVICPLYSVAFGVGALMAIVNKSGPRGRYRQGARRDDE